MGARDATNEELGSADHRCASLLVIKIKIVDEFLLSILTALLFPFLVMCISDTSIKLVFDSGCKTTYANGSNNCDFK